MTSLAFADQRFQIQFQQPVVFWNATNAIQTLKMQTSEVSPVEEYPRVEVQAAFSPDSTTLEMLSPSVDKFSQNPNSKPGGKFSRQHMKKTAKNGWLQRRRMNSINAAFEKLRGVLPALDCGRKMSKYETLQMAQQYIGCLDTILNDPNGLEKCAELAKAVNRQ